ncbi:hypothetical protein Syun_022893 [Stephania yunnanensis]|uniref:Uncharacterized protein n=1 Tax=Stephania yunnanensis TaxID=152371 RepID=A0AAP0FAJ8_9MAGN
MARPCSCQGMTLFVPKESAKVSPYSCPKNLPMFGLARAKARPNSCPKNLLRFGLARAKARPCSCPGNLPRFDLACAKTRPCSCPGNLPRVPSDPQCCSTKWSKSSCWNQVVSNQKGSCSGVKTSPICPIGPGGSSGGQPIGKGDCWWSWISAAKVRMDGCWANMPVSLLEALDFLGDPGSGRASMDHTGESHKMILAMNFDKDRNPSAQLEVLRALMRTISPLQVLRFLARRGEIGRYGQNVRSGNIFDGDFHTQS